MWYNKQLLAYEKNIGQDAQTNVFNLWNFYCLCTHSMNTKPTVFFFFLSAQSLCAFALHWNTNIIDRVWANSNKQFKLDASVHWLDNFQFHSIMFTLQHTTSTQCALWSVIQLDHFATLPNPESEKFHPKWKLNI